METAHPHSNELQILRRRIRVCGHLQKFNDTPLTKWATEVQPELEATLNAVSDYWPTFPLHLKLKLAAARGMLLMSKLSSVKVDAEHAAENLQTVVSTMVAQALPNTRSCEWQTLNPTNGALLQHVFQNLSAKVTALSNGEDISDEDMESAAQSCTMALTDPWIRQR